MPPFKTPLVIVLTCLLLCGCHNKQREQQLAQREQTVIEKEKEFALKEADYKSLVRMRDSLLTKRDTVIIQQWPEEIAGLWSSRSVCRESNCSDYVIGDQRSNMWEFVSDSTGLFTRVLDNNNQLVRVYAARLDSAGIKLHYATDSSASKQMDLNIDLNQVSPALLKGVQTIRVDQSCNAKFLVELTRINKR